MTERNGNMVETFDSQADEKIRNRNEIIKGLKRKAWADLSERLMKLIHLEVRNADVETLNICDIKCIRKNVDRARRSVLISGSIRITIIRKLLLTELKKNSLLLMSVRLNKHVRIMYILCTTSYIDKNSSSHC